MMIKNRSNRYDIDENDLNVDMPTEDDDGHLMLIGEAVDLINIARR
jgi:hypothetical protein